MIEEKQLHRLGDDPRSTSTASPIGFGAGIEIGWAAGPIKLEASAQGPRRASGTNPFLLKGGIFGSGAS